MGNFACGGSGPSEPEMEVLMRSKVLRMYNDDNSLVPC